MPVKYSDSSDDSSPSHSSRLVRRVSKPVGSFRVRKHTRFKSKDEYVHSQVRSPPRCNTRSSRNSSGRGPGSSRRHSALNTDGGHDSRRHLSEESSTAETNPFRRRRRSHTLETVQEVSSGHTSRRTTLFSGSQSQQEPAKRPGGQSMPAERLHAQHSSACSDMHQSVESGDYLLARGANPRTGIVTPADSTNSSLGDHTATTETQHRPPRWRQKNDQWISLDLGEPTPISMTPLERFPEYQPPPLRIPQKLVPSKPRDSKRGSSLIESKGVGVTQAGPEGAFRTSQRPTGNSLPLNEKTEAQGDTVVQRNHRLDPPVKRKPVGSPPNRNLAERVAHTQEASDESTDTVLRKPRINDDLRSSSAPDTLRVRTLNPQNANKDLPTVPNDSALYETRPATTSDPFLESRGTDHPANVPSSKTSNIFGPQTTEKELPCLPTNNGPSQSTHNSPPYPTSPTKITAEPAEGCQRIVTKAPQGPREGGDPAYPYIRRARPTYPISPPTGRQQPIGARTMAIPVYDNPPKHRSPLARTTGPGAEGPRSMPLPEMSVLEKTRLALNSSWNTTTIPTGISIDGPGLRIPLQAGPRPVKPDMQMNHGQPGLPRRPAPPSGSGIIMNTTTNMSTDSMMSIPMRRVRPRAMTRPGMPTRTEGTYGIPKIDQGQWRCDPTGRDHQQQRMRDPIGTVPTTGITNREPVLMPEALKPRIQPSQIQSSETDTLPERAELKSTNCGLMRKCSRCIHGFVDVKLHSIDSVIHTSDLQKDDAEAKEGTNLFHPCRSPLPGLPEDQARSTNDVSQQGATTLSHPKAGNEERDHTICCPECCKLDCHEGCLGHPSPMSSPSPANSMWSEAQTPSSISEVSTPAAPAEGKTEKAEQRTKINAIDFVKSALKPSPKKDQGSKSGSGHIHAALSKPPVELSVQRPTPTMPSTHNVLRRQGDTLTVALSALKPPAGNETREAIPAAMSAMGLAQRRVTPARPNIHRRQRSNSSPIVGLGITSRKSSGYAESSRTATGSHLRIPSPIGLALACSAYKDGSSRSRNVSGTSINTIEVQMPNLASYTALSEMVFVPLEAVKMWLKTHPQTLTMGGDVLRRAWEMAQIMTKTAWKVWAIIFVYSKTGKIRYRASNGETPGAFLMDVARSLLYFLLFAAVSAFFVRILGCILSVLRVGVWFLKAALWLIRSILGVGSVK
ncbi:hypothetical protein PV04_06177 [Phialophora macrospora]|uniref:Uncharacterized protein n=1 Tax=Phialophora macrospora TaxID=1851006 RepID=A0A0D2FFQ4_9EURO|nr:hypothetical protein PV04_06177 [Phialophora macrospora]